MGPIILKVKDLKVKFGHLSVLSNVDFELTKGESLAVIGPNGSGKTTLLRALMKTISFEGVVEWSADAKIAYVPQRIDLEKNLPLTVRDFLLSKIKLWRLEVREMERVLQLVNLPLALVDHKLGLLSAGQFQRATIAFALIGSPNVILFDEPTAEVDLPGEEQLYDTLHRLQDEQQITLIIISHDLSLVFRYATKVICLNRQMLCYGVPKEILTTDQLHQLYGVRGFYHHIHGSMNSPQVK